MKDIFVKCGRCGRETCYEQHVSSNVHTWLCLSCGFTTTTDLVKGSDVLETTIKSSPSLYRDLLFEGDNGQIWAPATVSVPNIGMVFLDGKTKEDWGWVGVRAIALTAEEKKGNRYPKGQTHKMDTKKMVNFGKEGFLQAFEYAGLLDE